MNRAGTLCENDDRNAHSIQNTVEGDATLDGHGSDWSYRNSNGYVRK